MGSSRSPRRSSVGYTEARAERLTPGMSFQRRAQARTDAPVLPAETRASPSPRATKSAATTIDASGLAARASDGFSSIWIAAPAWCTRTRLPS